MASLPAGSLHGAAHITGGGLLDNLPRVLPKTCRAAIRKDSWQVPELFRLIQKGGKIPEDEMYQVFNMGIGMTLVVPKKQATQILAQTKGLLIGEIVEGPGDVVLV
jgi:phosphoribosylformylglycinamidine cyclo-ligase